MKVEIKELTVTYDDADHKLLALDKVDLTLSPGKITALIGESGSGKTTLGKAVMGLLPENAHMQGQISIGDKNILEMDEKALNRLRWTQAAMVFQNGAANLNPVYRLIDQTAEPLVQRQGMARRQALSLAAEMLQQMGLPRECATRFPHELSGGQIQRALLAMALILDPEVLILDEPTAALDAMTKSFIMGLVDRLRERSKSILLITHDMDLAARLADETAVLYLGQIMESMPAKDLMNNARHPYSLALVRSYPSMDAVRDLGGIRGDAFFRTIHAHSKEFGDGHEHLDSGGPKGDGHAPFEGCLFEPRCTQALPECRSGRIPLTASGNRGMRCLRGGIVELLKCQNVSKSYGKVQALKPVNLSLMSGETFCLVGETGSGKTTLSMIAAGALQPDQGSRIFEDRDMDAWINKDYISLAPKIGIINQNPAEAVSSRLRVFDIAAEPLRIQCKGLSKQEISDRVLAAVKDVHLSTSPDFLKRYPHELNMGAIQRLCLARALVHKPNLLIADEPTSALDPSVQAKILKMLLNLQIEKGMTMLFVTHDIGLARKIGDRIGVMLEGRLVEVGPAAQIIANPRHEYTRMLMDGANGLLGRENFRDGYRGQTGLCTADSAPGPEGPWGRADGPGVIEKKQKRTGLFNFRFKLF